MRSPAVTHTVNFGVCHSHSPSWPSQNKTAWLWLLTVPSGYKAPLELGQEERKHNNPIMMNELIKDRGEKKIGAHWALSSMKTRCLHPACRAEHGHWFGDMEDKFSGGPRPPSMCCSVGQAEGRDGSYTASYTRQDCGLGLVTTEYQGYAKCASPLSAYSHSGASPPQRICSLAGGSGAPFPLQQARQLTKRFCFCVFPQPCVALQK